jgi:putative Ca2+/H+ antiporter (TMEM165/GDT1 family)
MTTNKRLMIVYLSLILISLSLAEDVTGNSIKEESKFTLSKLVEAFTTIFLSGLFDKSFFITAFMAVKYSKCLVFVSASLALSFVGALSVFLGLAINKYIPAIWVDIFAVALFLFFGVKLLVEGIHLGVNNLNKQNQNLNGDQSTMVIKEHNVNTTTDLEENTNLINISSTTKTTQSHSHSLEDIKKTTEIISYEKSGLKVFLKVFILIFASEIGDRSQISTIYLTSNFDKFVVLSSSVFSQVVLTILAITAGVLVSNKVSERNLTIIAGLTFLAFGVVALYFLYVEHSDFLLGIAAGNKVKLNDLKSDSLIPDKSLIKN